MKEPEERMPDDTVNPTQPAQENAGLPPAAPDTTGRRRPERSRVGAVWTALAVAVVVLLLLLVFILQNQLDVQVSYLWMSGTLPLGLALLFAAVGGALLVVLVGVARIAQLRILARRQRGAGGSRGQGTAGARK